MTTTITIKTARDLKKALKNVPELAGKFEIRGAGSGVEVELVDEGAMDVFQARVTSTWGGYSTGYGAWVLRPDHRTDGVDFNHVASRSHY